MEEKARLEERITEKHVKTFLDILVLAMLNSDPMYGYKIIAAIHEEFGVLLSPGSLYPLLRFLEEERLIESHFKKGKIVYYVTSRGKKKFGDAFAAYKASIEKVSNFVEAHGNFSS